MIILTNCDCCEGRHKGLHFWPRDVGKENSLIIRIRFVPGNTSLNLSASGEFKCIGASGAITYLFVEQIGNITVAFAQYTKCAVNSKTYKYFVKIKFKTIVMVVRVIKWYRHQQLGFVGFLMGNTLITVAAMMASHPKLQNLLVALLDTITANCGRVSKPSDIYKRKR